MFDALKTDPIAFTLPFGDAGFAIYWYGILIMIGIVLGTLWASREIEKRKQSADELWNGLIVVLVAGYLFARLWYVAQDVIAGNGSRYTSFLDVINLRQGGANILGGFIGAFVAALLYIRWRKLRLWHYADVAGPALMLAEAVGRWGNFINQELYGPPTKLPWGILVDPAYRITPYNILTDYPMETRFHPTFFYTSIWLLAGYIVLTQLNRHYRDTWRTGTLFGLFLLWWGGGRFVIEFFRPDQPTIGDSVITYSMLFALILALGGVWVLLRRYGLIGRSKQDQRVYKPKPRRTPTA